jgi:hypothetical protein
MIAPQGAEITEGELATFWFDEKGILCAVAKDTGRTLQKQIDNYKLIREIAGNKRICLLSDATLSAPMDKQTRDYISKELPEVIKAMAVISHSATGSFTSIVFMSVKQTPIPMKLFDNEQDAREWLMQYL